MYQSYMTYIFFLIKMSGTTKEGEPSTMSVALEKNTPDSVAFILDDDV